MGGRRGPFRFFRNRKEDTRRERERQIISFLQPPPPQIFETSAGSVCCCAISTYYYVLLHLDTRLDLNLRSDIHKVIAKRLPCVDQFSKCFFKSNYA